MTQPPNTTDSRGCNEPQKSIAGKAFRDSIKIISSVPSQKRTRLSEADIIPSKILSILALHYRLSGDNEKTGKRQEKDVLQCSHCASS